MSKRTVEAVYSLEGTAARRMNGLSADHSTSNGTNGTISFSGDNELKKARLDDQFHGHVHGDSGSLNSTNTNGNAKREREQDGVINGNGQHSAAQSPSKVVHIRGVPNDCQESEIVQLGLAFGRISNVLILKGKNQAFLEMADEASAAAMVNYYNSGFPCMVKNRQCYVQHSTHRELKTDHNNSFRNSLGIPDLSVSGHVQHPSIAAALKNNASLLPIMLSQQQNQLGMASLLAAQSLSGLGVGLPAAHSTGAHIGQQQDQSQNAAPGGGINTILRVVIENNLYPVSLDVIHAIFSRFGKVLRIITFTKNSQYQALIQYPDRPSAAAAKQSLDGQNIYTGCCTLRIEYSRLETLRVNYNNDKSRDYTNPNLPSGDSSMMNDSLSQLPGFVPAGISPHTLLHGLGASSAAAAGLSGMSGPAYNTASLLQGLQSAGTLGVLGGLGGGRLNGPGSVVLISNINEELVTPEALFILFGVYGDVMRVKILFNKKDTALIQYAEPRQAQLAIMHLDRVKLFGKALKVTASRHSEVQLPKDNQPDCGLTRDFSNSPLHRFKKPGSKNYLNIYPPQSTLHLSNLPPNISEEEVLAYFEQNGFHVKHFRFFPKDHKMALVQLGSVDEAVDALVKMHNFQLNENTHLRVSFSKATIKE